MKKYFAAGNVPLPGAEHVIVHLPFFTHDEIDDDQRKLIAQHLCMANGLEYLYSEAATSSGLDAEGW